MNELYDKNIIEELQPLVIQVCSIKNKEDFYNSTQLHFTHARWLMFYAIRHFTKMSYTNIFMLVKDMFSISHYTTISNAVRQMSRMIDTDYTWSARWNSIKKQIPHGEKKERPKIVVIAPDGIDIEIKRR